MKTRWILVFLIIGLFFVSGQTGCEPIPIQDGSLPGSSVGGQSVPRVGVSSGGNFPGLNIESIRTIPTTIREDKEFSILINLKNNGKEVDPTLRLWATNRGLGVLSTPEEIGVSLGNALIDGIIESKEELVSFGEYFYSGLEKDTDTKLMLDVISEYYVRIIPSKEICVAKIDSTKDCSKTETFGSYDLGYEATAVPITVSSIVKSFDSTADDSYLDLQITLNDNGQGSGSNNIINNFYVGFTDGTELSCDKGPTIDIFQLKKPIVCSARIPLVQEVQSYQLVISFDYDYSIKSTIPISIKKERELA